MYTHFLYSNLAKFQDAGWEGEIHRGPQNTSRGFQAEPTVSTFLKKQLYFSYILLVLKADLHLVINDYIQ